MINPKKRKNVKTVFRSYFSKQKINTLVKHLYIAVPTPNIFIKLINLKLKQFISPLFENFSKEKQRLRNKDLPVLDLDKLNEELAVVIKNKDFHYFHLNQVDKISFSSIELRNILDRQSELLQMMLSEQKAILQEEAKHIINEEQSKFRRQNRKSNY